MVNSEFGVCISMERLQQLIQAEHDANHLKGLIADRYESYRIIDRDELKLLNDMFCGKKEEV